MLRKYSTNRTFEQNLLLGGITATASGMVNVASVMAFFAYTTNITGHVAVLAEEISKGHWHQVFIVGVWLFLFFIGGFLSSSIVINLNKYSAYYAHALPIFIEMLCLLFVAVYGHYFYHETLAETEYLIGLLLFSMGLQNGLTSSVSNFTVKTTHLTGLLTDLSVSISMFLKPDLRKNKVLVMKIKLLSTVAVFYLLGGVLGGLIFLKINFLVFYFVAAILLLVLSYDFYNIGRVMIMRRKR